MCWVQFNTLEHEPGGAQVHIEFPGDMDMVSAGDLVVVWDLSGESGPNALSSFSVWQNTSPTTYTYIVLQTDRLP
jgi:hypothetical protein